MVTPNYIKCIENKPLLAYFALPLLGNLQLKNAVIKGWIVPTKDVDLVFELDSFYTDLSIVVLNDRYFLISKIDETQKRYFKHLIDGNPKAIPKKIRKRIYDFWFPTNDGKVLWLNSQRTYHPLYYLLFPEVYIEEELKNRIWLFFVRRGYPNFIFQECLYPNFQSNERNYVTNESTESAAWNIYQNLIRLETNPFSLIELNFVLTTMTVFCRNFNDWDINFYSSINSIPGQSLTKKQKDQLFRINIQIFSTFFRKSLVLKT